MTDKYKFETLQIHAGQEKPDPATGARAVPIYQTTSFVFPSSKAAADRFSLTAPGNIYTRMMNPTWDVFEQRIAALENGAAALALSSGAAATTYAIQNITRAGDHIVSDKQIYGGTYNLFANTFRDMGVETSFVDGSNPENFAKAVKPNTKAIFFETLGNPNSSIIDIEAVSEIAHKFGIETFDANQNHIRLLFQTVGRANQTPYGMGIRQKFGARLRQFVTQDIKNFRFVFDKVRSIII